MSSASAGAGLVCCCGRCCSDGDATSGTDRGGLLLVLLLSLLPLPLLAEVDVVLDEELGPGEGGTAAAAPVAGATARLCTSVDASGTEETLQQGLLRRGRDVAARESEQIPSPREMSQPGGRQAGRFMHK